MAIEQPPLVVDPELLDDLPKPSPYTLAEASVPDRMSVPISVRPSLIDTKNKGLYVDEAVYPGYILFEIEKPLLAIIEHKDTRSRTRDNCFAYQSVEDEIGTVSTVERDLETAIPFDQCGSCGVHHYCDMREAFEHHHKHECLTFVDFLSEEPLAESFIERTDFRFVLRFLRMAKANLLTEAIMREFFTAPIGNLYDFDPSKETSYRNLSLNMKALANSPVHEDSVVRILCFAVHQSIMMYQPFICEFNRPGLDKELLKAQLAIDNKVIADLKSNGFGYDCPDLRRAYLSVFSGQFDRDYRTITQNYKGSLRLLLTVYYLIDPVACPAPSPEERIKVLYFLIVIAYIRKDPRFKVSEIVFRMRKFIYHWRSQLVHYSRQMSGPNTRIATFHRNAFKEDLEAGDIPVYTDKDSLVKELNSWFKLLDLAEMTSEQILRT